MSVIRMVWGSATAPTETSAYDGALAEANVHNYNIVTVSSVIPAGPAVETVGTAPDLGAAGQQLTVVQARETVAPGERGPAVAGIGWARSESGRGIFYEEAGTDAAEVQRRIERGLARGKELRDWAFVEEESVVETATAEADGYTTTVVCAVYGEASPIL